MPRRTPNNGSGDCRNIQPEAPVLYLDNELSMIPSIIAMKIEMNSSETLRLTVEDIGDDM